MTQRANNNNLDPESSPETRFSMLNDPNFTIARATTEVDEKHIESNN